MTLKHPNSKPRKPPKQVDSKREAELRRIKDLPVHDKKLAEYQNQQGKQTK